MNHYYDFAACFGTNFKDELKTLGCKSEEELFGKLKTNKEKGISGEEIQLKLVHRIKAYGTNSPPVPSDLKGKEKSCWAEMYEHLYERYLSVKRNSKDLRISYRDLLVGDVVLIQAGDWIDFNAILFECSDGKKPF